MINSNKFSLCTLLVIFVVTSCSPIPPERVNSRLPSPYQIYEIKSDLQPDTFILAECQKIKEYSKKVKGNWEHHWYIADWKVINVEKGKWDKPNLIFVFAYTTTTPDSGITLRVEPLPYRVGKMFSFGLSTSKKLPVIVQQEERKNTNQ